MRLGFAITGIGAACAFAVVTSRTTLSHHLMTRNIEREEQQRTPGRDLITRDAFDTIRLDSLLQVEDPEALHGPVTSLRDALHGDFEPLATLTNPFGRFGPDFASELGLGLAAQGNSVATSDIVGSPPDTPVDPPAADPLTPPSAGFSGLTSSGGGGPIIPPTPDPEPDPRTPGPPPPPSDPGKPPVTPPPPPPPGKPPPPIIQQLPLVSSFVAPPPSAAPEPSTWAMLLIGFGAMGLALRRGRVRLAPAVRGR